MIYNLNQSYRAPLNCWKSCSVSHSMWGFLSPVYLKCYAVHRLAQMNRTLNAFNVTDLLLFVDFHMLIIKLFKQYFNTFRLQKQRKFSYWKKQASRVYCMEYFVNIAFGQSLAVSFWLCITSRAHCCYCNWQCNEQSICIKWANRKVALHIYNFFRPPPDGYITILFAGEREQANLFALFFLLLLLFRTIEFVVWVQFFFVGCGKRALLVIDVFCVIFVFIEKATFAHSRP